MFGWLTSLLSGPADDRLDHVRYPDSAYATQVDAIASLLSTDLREYEWASFDARDGEGSEWVTVQVRGARVNTLAEPVDLIGMLRAAGHETLANKAQPADMAEQRRAQAFDVEFHERPVVETLFSIAGATPAELAEVVHAIFTQHYSFSPMYELNGSRQD